ncbi:acetoacetate decarboxylase family protein [Allorhizocola rhizosphaerae]|uniref:acetoacetate decarboxylase family protein n=1 Tax=Allorhizocola rhizosphaerae TaxID=1872709 RepID=UPI001B8C9160|nr:acetoacetate decarboxylase family protein [Allorhizocola rhizosphaerae]
MTDDALPPEVAYPSPPWRMTGRLWMAFVRTAADVAVPADLAPVGGRRRLAVALVRYEAGTLRYDEFAVGPLVRRGARVGVLTEHIWVDDPASLWGGRRLWGIPKLMARFDWHDNDRVSVHSGHDLIAELVLRPARWRLPPMPIPAAGFGQIDDQRTYLRGRCVARPAPARVDIMGWSDRLPALAGTAGPASSGAGPTSSVAGLPAMELAPCRFAFPHGRVLGKAG